MSDLDLSGFQAVLHRLSEQQRRYDQIAEEKRKAALVAAAATADASSLSSKEDGTDLTHLREEVSRQEAILETLSSISGVRVMDLSVNETKQTILHVAVKEIQVMITLDESHSITNIQFLPSSALAALDGWLTEKDLLSMANSLPTPKDLRQVLFVLSNAVAARQAYQSDLTTIRRRCLVRLESPNTAKLTFQSGIVANIRVTPTYNFQPGSVQITELTDTDSNTTIRIDDPKTYPPASSGNMRLMEKISNVRSQIFIDLSSLLDCLTSPSK